MLMQARHSRMLFFRRGALSRLFKTGDEKTFRALCHGAAQGADARAKPRPLMTVLFIDILNLPNLQEIFWKR